MTQLAEQGSAGSATAEEFEAAGRDLLPGSVGIEFDSVEAGEVWDAEVTDGAGRTLALLRCTQMVLCPKAVAA